MNTGSWELTPALITILESGDHALVHELLTMFLDNTQGAIEVLLAGTLRERAPESRKILHGLKTGCAQFGAKDLARLARHAEIALETNDVETAFVTVTEMEKTFPAMKIEVESFLATPKNSTP
ncbi:MAG: Hpt domain-containing protein [Bryobacteraceae bacterium]